MVASSQFVYGQGKYKCKKDGVVFPKDRNDDRLINGMWDLQCPKCKGKITPLANDESHANPPNQYAISKYCQEQIALKLGKLYNTPSAALRYSIVHGSRQSIKNAYSGALKQFVLWLSEGDTRHSFSDISKLTSLGWKPSVSEERSISEFVKWAQTQKDLTKALGNVED